MQATIARDMQLIHIPIYSITYKGTTKVDGSGTRTIVGGHFWGWSTVHGQVQIDNYPGRYFNLGKSSWKEDQRQWANKICKQIAFGSIRLRVFDDSKFHDFILAQHGYSEHEVDGGKTTEDVVGPRYEKYADCGLVAVPCPLVNFREEASDMRYYFNGVGVAGGDRIRVPFELSPSTLASFAGRIEYMCEQVVTECKYVFEPVSGNVVFQKVFQRA
jgi:hypothetical protein